MSLLSFQSIAFATENPGDLDTSFGLNGTLRMMVPRLESAYVDSADRIYITRKISEGNIQIVRFLPDGKSDAGYGVAGNLMIQCSQIMFNKDGSVIALNSDPNGFHLQRYTSEGLLDNHYAQLGSLLINFSPDSRDVYLIPTINGLIAYIDTSGVVNNDSGAIIMSKVSADGTLDASFGTNGYANPS